MLIADYQKIMTDNRPFLWQISILGNLGPLVSVKDINFFENIFDFVNAHIKRQLFRGLQYPNSNFKIFTPPYCALSLYRDVQSHLE